MSFLSTIYNYAVQQIFPTHQDELPNTITTTGEIARLNFSNLASSFCATQVDTTPKLDGNKIAEALLSEAAFTVASDQKPIVATYGCGPCVAVGGYDPTNKIAFVVHFALAEEVRKSGGLVFYNISKLVKEPITTPIQLHLRGGIEGQSEATIEAIKIWKRQRSDLPMEIVSEDILESDFGSKSLSIDSRTGKVSEYHPLANPKHREMSALDSMGIMSQGLWDPKIKLAYSPK